MDRDKKDLLLDKLTISLQEQAKALGQGPDLPELKRIYELKEAANLYFYLKEEHDFTPDEVNALLKFENPMEVAMGCWESNTAQYGFDICDIMDAINCWEDYPLSTVQ